MCTGLAGGGAHREYGGESEIRPPVTVDLDGIRICSNVLKYIDKIARDWWKIGCVLVARCPVIANG